jgi:hypothetical protein
MTTTDNDYRKTEIARQIEIAERVLRETAEWRGWHSFRDRTWLQDEHARLVRELRELEQRHTDSATESASHE